MDPLQDKLEEVFNLFDSGDKGEIDSRELGTVIRALGYTFFNFINYFLKIVYFLL